MQASKISLLAPEMVMTEHVKDEGIFKLVPDLNRAKIAQLLIEEGLRYLRSLFIKSKQDIPLSSQKTIEEAIDLIKYLVFQVESLKKEAIEWNIKLKDPKIGEIKG